jgi:hypothetical protein
MTADEVRPLWRGSNAWLVRRLAYWFVAEPRLAGAEALLARIRLGPAQGDEAITQLAEDLGRQWISAGAPDPPRDD